MDNVNDTRHGAIATAIAAELERQGIAASIDIEALATAIIAAVTPSAETEEGLRPESLNANNDG